MEDKKEALPQPIAVNVKCDRCKRGNRGKLEPVQGHDGRFCSSCATGLRKWAREGRQPPPFTGATWARPKKKDSAEPQKAPSALKSAPPTPSKAATPIAPQRQAQPASTALAAVPQPPPSSGRRDVTVEVIRDLVARSDFGAAKYGGRLMTSNGRDALMDAYQEALDLVAYLKQALLERDAA